MKVCILGGLRNTGRRACDYQSVRNNILKMRHKTMSGLEIWQLHRDKANIKQFTKAMS